jgi:hypothetical protein
MFIEKQSTNQIEYYKKMLQTIGSLSRLFSENKQPFLHYRVAENLFCKSFQADNLSRSDVSVDASLNNIGFGLKTFLNGNGRKMEKVAEFNSHSSKLRKIDPEKQVYEIARLRNDRISTTKNIYNLDQIIYHCVTRSEGKMSILETPMNEIDLDSIKIISTSDKSLVFKDKYEEYSFNLSKSTLLKRFIFEEALLEVPVDIINDPFDLLQLLFSQERSEVSKLYFAPISENDEHIFLPLYSTRGGMSEKTVPEKSGLNQWNAAGRPRNMGEVYIPIPAWIHDKFADFFPERDQQFKLQLPNKEYISAKVCQEGGKALMSNPNTALGQWILRDVLQLKEGELLTYDKLRDIGLDSVVIYKVSDLEYKIDFAKIGLYNSFEKKNK